LLILPYNKQPKKYSETRIALLQLSISRSGADGLSEIFFQKLVARILPGAKVKVGEDHVRKLVQAAAAKLRLLRPSLMVAQVEMTSEEVVHHPVQDPRHLFDYKDLKLDTRDARLHEKRSVAYHTLED
jgi:hypothetical protein